MELEDRSRLISLEFWFLMDKLKLKQIFLVMSQVMFL